MPEEISPTDEQIRRYYRRELSPEELIALSDYFVKHPEERRLMRKVLVTRPLDATSPAFPQGEDRIARYEDLIAKLEGAVADPVERKALETRLAKDPLASTYLADLAAFKQEMAMPPESTRGSDNELCQ